MEMGRLVLAQAGMSDMEAFVESWPGELLHRVAALSERITQWAQDPNSTERPVVDSDLQAFLLACLGIEPLVNTETEADPEAEAEEDNPP